MKCPYADTRVFATSVPQGHVEKCCGFFVATMRLGHHGGLCSRSKQRFAAPSAKDEESSLLTVPEQRVMRAFRRFLVRPGEMLCFYGPELKRYSPALRQLTEKEYLVKEQFKGAYSLTKSGFVAMKTCD